MKVKVKVEEDVATIAPAQATTGTEDEITVTVSPKYQIERAIVGAMVTYLSSAQPPNHLAHVTTGRKGTRRPPRPTTRWEA